MLDTSLTLQTVKDGLNGWTIIKRSNQRPIMYTRKEGQNKIEPGNDLRMLSISESGAVCVMSFQENPSKATYLETHFAMIKEGKSKSEVIGSKCILEGVSLFSQQKASDGRGAMFVFIKGDQKYTICLNQQGELTIKETK